VDAPSFIVREMPFLGKAEVARKIGNCRRMAATHARRPRIGHSASRVPESARSPDAPCRFIIPRLSLADTLNPICQIPSARLAISGRLSLLFDDSTRIRPSRGNRLVLFAICSSRRPFRSGDSTASEFRERANSRKSRSTFDRDAPRQFSFKRRATRVSR